jgi:large subunit ribosomal protein L35
MPSPRLKSSKDRKESKPEGDFPLNKQKTSKSAAKRFKVTAKGKILRRHSHARHILTKKPRKRVRKLVDSALVSKADKHKVKKMLKI